MTGLSPGESPAQARSSDSFASAESGVTAEGFMAALDAWLAWFRAGRISEALGWMTPDEYRLSRGYAL